MKLKSKTNIFKIKYGRQLIKIYTQKMKKFVPSKGIQVNSDLEINMMYCKNGRS